MQWLIDLVAERVIATIGIPPTYIDRGDPAAIDYTVGDFTRDDTWRELDLSAIVPEGATAVALTLVFNYGATNRHAYFRKNGNANDIIFTGLTNPVATLDYIGDLVCAVSSDRKIDYKISTGIGMVVNLSVKGWWL